MDKSKQRNQVNALLTTAAAATILGIMLIIPPLFVAGTGEQGINAYGQLIPPSQLQEGEQQEGGAGGGQAITINGAGANFSLSLD